MNTFYSISTIATILIWSLLAVFTLWQLTRWTPSWLERHAPMPYIIALLPLAPLALVALTLMSIISFWCGVTSAPAACGVCLILLILSLYSYTPYWQYQQSATPTNISNDPNEHPSLMRIMTLNCRYGHADAPSIVNLVTTKRIDVLLLQEVTTQLVEQLVHVGIGRELPYFQESMRNVHENGGYNAIFTRTMPVERHDSTVAIDAASVPSMTLALQNSAAVCLYSAHPKSPMRGCKAWSDGIRALANLATSTQCADAKSPQSANPQVTIVAGDLNSTVDHPSFRSLLKRGFKDTAIALGKRQNTWPSWLRWPRLNLDHVLVAAHSCKVRIVEQHAICVEGSDHLALIARIAIIS